MCDVVMWTLKRHRACGGGSSLQGGGNQMFSFNLIGHFHLRRGNTVDFQVYHVILIACFGVASVEVVLYFYYCFSEHFSIIFRKNKDT